MLKAAAAKKMTDKGNKHAFKNDIRFPFPGNNQNGKGLRFSFALATTKVMWLVECYSYIYSRFPPKPMIVAKILPENKKNINIRRFGFFVK